MGKAKIAITPVTTTENNVDFLSTNFSGLNKVISYSDNLNLKTTGSNFEYRGIKLEWCSFEPKIQDLSLIHISEPTRPY